MFSGIVSAVGTIRERVGTADSLRLLVDAPMFTEHVDVPVLGESISVSGACLTVTRLEGGAAWFDLAAETCRRTTLGEIGVGSRVNLERSLRLGARIDGHLVLGHVDAVGTVLERAAEGTSSRMRIALPKAIEALVVEKGSITVDGVSLTVGTVAKDSFDVFVIPHTLAVTTLGTCAAGTKVNLEADSIARYHQSIAARYLTTMKGES